MAKMYSTALAKRRQCVKMSGPERRANVTPALDHATPTREVQTMTHCGQYRDSVAKINLEQFVTLSAHYDAGLDVEGEALYYLTAALEVIRPSILHGIAANTASLAEFTKCLKLAMMATSYPERAEAYAGEAVDAMPDASKADAVYGLIMLAAAKHTLGDGTWRRLASVTRRVVAGGAR